MILFLLAFVAFLIIGIPISVSIGFSAVLGCLSLGYPLVVIGQKMVSGIDSWLLIAIPLFILAGNLMNAGKITDELFGTARELVGWIPGGLGHANVLASVIFAGMSALLLPTLAVWALSRSRPCVTTATTMISPLPLLLPPRSSAPSSRPRSR